MFVTEEGLFATSVFFLLGGVAGIVVFWFIFYFGWSEPKNTSSRDSKQI